jgi:predicted NUDIX family phosphoesterase
MERIQERGFFIERRFTENDSSFKQIIPYSLITHGQRILVLTRTDKQGEARLHNKKSVGVGGHINPVDGMDEPLRIGCRREIEEELEIIEDYEANPVGIINDESNSVGSVHFGVVHVVKLKRGDVKVRETAMMTAEFVEYPALQEMAGQGEYNFETWSSLIIQSTDLHMLLD